MPKKPISVTLEADNLLWLRSRVAAGQRRSLSEALDDVVRAARQGGFGAEAIRSVVGTIDVAADDPTLEGADAFLRQEFQASLTRPVIARETPPAYGSPQPARRKKGRRG